MQSGKSEVRQADSGQKDSTEQIQPLQKDENSMQLAVVSMQGSEDGIKVVEDVMPLAVHTENRIDFSNREKICLDEEDLEKNIEKIAIASNLSSKQIDKLKMSQGIQRKKDKRARASSMQTRSSLKNKSR